MTDKDKQPLADGHSDITGTPMGYCVMTEKGYVPISDLYQPGPVVEGISFRSERMPPASISFMLGDGTGHFDLRLHDGRVEGALHGLATLDDVAAEFVENLNRRHAEFLAHELEAMAWVIFCRDSHGTLYWSSEKTPIGTVGCAWAAEPDNAIRYARESDALAVIANAGWHATTTRFRDLPKE